MIEVYPYKIEELIDDKGVNHFRKFLKSLSSAVDRAKILARLNRVLQGNLGQYKDLKDGVFELKFTGKGPGYRVYFGKKEDRIIVLIGGGAKKSQQKDISLAKALWKAYLLSEKE
jgi:putative addiction module killer protein